MNGRNSYWELVEAYLSGVMQEGEQAALEQKLETDPSFAAEFQECMHLITSLEDSGRQKQYRNMLRSISEEQKQSPRSWSTKTITLRSHYLRTAGIAAGIALLTTLSTFWIVTNSHQKQSSQLTQLRREIKSDIESIRKSQDALINNISTTSTPSPAIPADFSGTGFAISNDGYFVTNYHVTSGADSVYIENQEGQYFRAVMVSFDEKTDVAIFKVQYPNFRFGKAEVPYTLAAGKKPLGARVFTLGYPQDEIVYNEGYISSKNGFNGDSMQYRLELPASFGQSGSPVIDGAGNVIGVVTSKENKTDGATYAVSTKAIHNLIKSLPKDERVKMGKGNKLSRMNREQQIEQLEYYTFSVKVYKK